MANKEFQVEFNWEEVLYIGFVRPSLFGNEVLYIVDFESEDKDSFIQLILKKSTSSLHDWDFFCEEEDATKYYDIDLLNELAEAVEKKLAGRSIVNYDNMK